MKPLDLLPLLACLLLLRLAAHAGVRALPTRPGLPDLAMAPVAGLGSATMAALLLAPRALTRPFVDDDFQQYCATAAILAGTALEDVPVYALRPPGLSLPVALLSRWMPLPDAMMATSFGAVALLGTSSWLMATLVAGRSAGLAAALSLGAFAPLAAATRELTTYPLMSALHLLAATAAFAALRLRHPALLLAAGAAVGLDLLGDQFAVLWAAPALAVALAAALRQGPRLPRLALVLAPVALSALVARALPPQVAFFPDGRPPALHTLELRLDEHASLHLGAGGAGPAPSLSLPGAHPAQVVHGRDELLAAAGVESNPGFLWGWAGPADAWSAARTLWSLKGTQAPPFADGRGSHHLVPRQVRPGLIAIGGGLLLAAWALRRRPLHWLALALLAAPSLGWLLQLDGLGAEHSPPWPELGLDRGVMRVAWVRSKLLEPGFALAPAMAGVLFAVAAGEGRGEDEARGEGKGAEGGAGEGGAPAPSRRAQAMRLLLVASLVLALVLGTLPSALAPDAPWRMRMPGGTGEYLTAQADSRHPSVRRSVPPSPLGPCPAHLARDTAAPRLLR